MAKQLESKAIIHILSPAARSVFGAALVVAIVGTGCTSQEEESIQPESGPTTDAPAQLQQELELARVGDKSITTGQLESFYADIPSYLQSNKEGLEKVRRHLQTLIDMELLRFEALERGVDRLPVFTHKMHLYRKDKLVGLYQIKNIRVKVSVQEVQDHFKDQGLARQIRIAQIIVANEDSARLALQEIAEGRSFEDVAGTWSIHEETARHGGDTGRYVSGLDVPPELGKTLLALKKGKVSKPVNLGGRFALFKVQDETEVELDKDSFQKVYRNLFIERSVKERAVLADSLKDAFKLKLNRPSLGAFLTAMRSGGSPSEQTREIVLYRYDGGQITAGDLLDAASQLKYEVLDLQNEDVVTHYAEVNLVPDALFMKAALLDGLDKEENVAEWLAEQEAQELIIQLRVLILQERITISEEEVQQEYAENPDRYARPDRIEIQEILVHTEPEAQKLLERIQQGESIGALARQHSSRSPELRDEEGRRRFSAAAGPLYGNLVPLADKTPVGQLGGPLQVPGGYTIFKVLSREAVPSTLEQSRRRVHATVNWIKKQQVFEQLLTELRTKYAERVQIREDNLKLAYASH
jgi:parvulin-like peptidyl-prolyl isomerase